MTDDFAPLAARVAASIDRGGLGDLAAIPALRHLLRSPTLPLGELLRHLDGSPDAAALQRQAADPNADPALLALLAGAFPAAFCANPALPLLLLEDPAWPARFDPAAAGRLLSYADAPPDLVAAFAALGAPEAAHAARLHVALAGEAGDGWEPALLAEATALPAVPDDDLLAVLIALGAVPGWLLPRVARSAGPQVAGALAAAAGDWSALAAQSRPPSRPNAAHIPAAELPRLLESEAPTDRALAAADPRVPAPLLLAAKEREDWTDVEYDVYEALAANPAAPPELLVALVRDRSALNTRTRRAVALHPHAPPEALALLVDEPYAADIRLILAAHPGLPPELRADLRAASLEQALGTPDPVYRAIALAHPTAAPATLVDDAESPCWLERVAVACNPATPAAARRLLREDGNRLVRAAARALEQP
jgi:hypothetical protein